MNEFPPCGIEIEKLLISKGIEESYIDLLKRKKRVKRINKNFHEYKPEEIIEAERGEWIDIPVSKIVSTHRTNGSCRTWWDNVFDSRFNNLSEGKWNRIQNIIQQESLEEFRESIYLSAPPLEGVTYYPDYDVYEVTEGHHRTIWAILTNSDTLKTKVLSVRRFNPKIYERRINYYKESLRVERMIKKVEQDLVNLIKLYDLTLVTKEADGRYVYYNGHPLYYFPKFETKSLIKSYFQENGNLLYTLQYTYSQLSRVIDTHNKLKPLPISARKFIAFVHYNIKGDNISEKLNELYSNGWTGKIK